MDWTEQFDGYCERVDFTYWSEPVNALTNAAFIVAALIMAYRTRGHLPSQLLCLILFAIGTGSYLFHTHATAWASLSDVAPIGLYILTYLFLVNFHIVGWPVWASALGTAAFLPYAAVMVPLLSLHPFLGISNFYWTVPILLIVYAALLRRKHPATARGFVIGAAILITSITLRSIDMQVCDAFPLGTHFLWHILNGLMLGYMIHVYHAHVLAGGSGER
ncbi:MAG: ceramidase domain-containing protein [Pseudomonadota bacterium]